MARLNFRQGIVQHQTDTGGNPTFLQESGGYVNLIVSPDPTIIAFVSGTTDYLYTESVSVNQAWGPFTPPTDQWLYWDLDLITGVVTRGATTFEPVEASAPPPTPGVGQMWFNTVTNTWSEYNGSTWAEVVRVFAAKYALSTTLQSMSINAPDFRGTQVGLTTSQRVGSLVFDVSGKPLRTGMGNKFFTTENAFVTGVPSAASLRVETITTLGQANQPIAAYHVVEFYEFNKIQPAQPFTQGLRALGILEEDVVTNEVANFVTSGTIYNQAWDWEGAGASVNDPVYFDNTGTIVLTEDTPNQLPVGVVIGPQEILFVPSLFPQVTAIGGGGGVTDHGLLDAPSLLDDDHPQYHNDARGDLRYLQLTGGILSGNLIMQTGTDVILTDAPVNPTDAANKQYVDNLASGLDFKDSAHMCSVSDFAGTYDNGTLGAGATLTAVTAGVLPPSVTDNHADYSGAAGTRNRILVKAQTDPIENGLYVITDLGSGENVTEVETVGDVADSLDGTYFTFEDTTGGVGFYVWYDTPAGAGDPAPGGSGIQVSIATGATVKQVTDATIAAINASGAQVTAYLDEDDEFYIVDDNIGTRSGSTAGTSGFTVSTTIPGTASPTPWILTRSDDADNSPTNEVSGGMFVFVEDGATCAGTGWVMTSPVGQAVLGTDELIFVQFSAQQVGPQSRIQDADNNTFVDVELTADSNRIIMNTAGRDAANSGGEIIMAVGPGAAGTGYDGAGITIDAGAADALSVAPNFGGSINLTSGSATPLSNDGRDGSITLTTPDASGIQEAGSIELRAGDNTTSVGGDIRLRPGSNAVAGAASAGVRIIGSPTLGATIESSLVFVPKANGDLGNGVGFQAPVTVGAELIWTLPATDGTNGQVLTTDGGGILSWSTAAGGASSRINDGDNDTFVETQNTLDSDNNIVMQAGFNNSNTAAKSKITITAGPAEQAAESSRQGGDIGIYAGIGNNNAVSGRAGNVTIAGGNVDGYNNIAGSNNAGDVSIRGGYAGVTGTPINNPNQTGNGGSVDIQAGNSTGYGPGGEIRLTAGTSDYGTTGGAVDIQGGGSYGIAGRVNIQTEYGYHAGDGINIFAEGSYYGRTGLYGSTVDQFDGSHNGQPITLTAGDNYSGNGGPNGAGRQRGGDIILQTGRGYDMGGLIRLRARSYSGEGGTKLNQVRIEGDSYNNADLVFQTGNNALTPVVGFTAPDTAASANEIWKLPNADGTIGQALITDGANELSWATLGLPAATDECTTLVANNASAFVERPALELPHPYDVAMQVFGEAPDGGIVLKFVAPHEIQILAHGNWGDAETPPTGGDRVFDVQINGLSVGIVVFEQNGSGRVFHTDLGITGLGGTTLPTAITLAQGDVLTMISPSDGDAQGSTGTGNAGLEDVGVTLRGHIIGGSAAKCVTPDFTLTSPSGTGTDFTISGAVGGIAHYEVACIGYGDPFETGVPATTTFYPLANWNFGGAPGFSGMNVNINDGAGINETVVRESEYVTLPYDATGFDINPNTGSQLYYKVLVCGFAPGGIVCKTGFSEYAGA